MLICLLPGVSTKVQASEPIADCVIRNFSSQIALNTDSTVDVAEDIVADCGTLQDKHGIFRVLPLTASRPAGVWNKTPVTLKNITDEHGTSYHYQTLNDSGTVTWKIGDANQTIVGVHHYLISYSVANATYSQTDGKIRFNWNLTGNFWQLPIDQVAASVVLPAGIVLTPDDIALYDGRSGSLAKPDATAHVSTQDKQIVVEVKKSSTLSPGQGVTLDTILPAGSVAVYQATLGQKFGGYLWLLLPLLALIICFRLWLKFGRDPKTNAPIIAQYTAPNNLRPLELAMVESYGSLKNQFVTATIIDLATCGYLTITEKSKTWLLGSKDWLMTSVRADDGQLKDFEKLILAELFGQQGLGATTDLSGHKKSFQKLSKDLKNSVVAKLEEGGLLDKGSIAIRNIFAGVFTAVFLLAYAVVRINSLFDLVFSLLGSFGIVALLAMVVIILIFTFLMPRRTVEGAKLLNQIKGFKLYLKTAEKYRLEFYEKEHLFEKYLPYAIAFGLVKEWTRAFKNMYGQSTTYLAPVWYISASGQPLSIDQFTTNMNSVVSQMSQSTGSSSGGGSGGGGGGGGGGSW